MSDDEFDYLSPGFDPATLTVPRIRSILVHHDIAYPSSAKKSQLVEAFSQQITPRAPKIRAARARTKRTSKGITDVPSSQESTVSGSTVDDSEESAPAPTPSAAKRRTKKSVQPPLEQSVEETPKPPKTTDRRRATKHPRASDSETGGGGEGVRPSARKSRRSEGPPIVKVEESEPTIPMRRPEESPFSDENPFQSGSSPLLATETRRRTTGARTDKTRASSGRRKTDQPTKVKQEDGIVPPSSRTFEMPVASLSKSRAKAKTPDPLAAGEEFTPEEESALLEEQEANGATKSRLVQRPAPRPSGGTLKYAPWVILMTLFAAYATWWRQEKIEVGYCGVGKPATTLKELQVPDWATTLQPQCEPCPLHGYCYADMVVRCEPAFVLQSHPWSLGGLIPQPPTCEPDGAKARKVKFVANKAVEELRDRRAKWECGDLKNEAGRVASSSDIDEVSLKAEVSQKRNQKRRTSMSDADFEELWRSALGEIAAHDDVTSVSDGATHLVRLSSSKLGTLPFGCRIRRWVRLSVAQYRVPLGLLGLGLLLAGYASRFYVNRRADRARVPDLVASTLDRLATQAARYAQGAADEPWISQSQMRDDVLRDEFSAARREAIWTKVRDVIEMNSNVRASVRENKHGEISRVWQWIGSTPSIENFTGGKQGRYSPSALEHEVAGAEPQHSESRIAGGQLRAEGRESRRWDEGRPIY